MWLYTLNLVRHKKVKIKVGKWSRHQNYCHFLNQNKLQYSPPHKSHEQQLQHHFHQVQQNQQALSIFREILYYSPVESRKTEEFDIISFKQSSERLTFPMSQSPSPPPPPLLSPCCLYYPFLECIFSYTLQRKMAS